jgi:hypothetical protein
MCEALAMVTVRGGLDRAAAGRFRRDAFMELQPQRQNYVWVGWQSAIAMLDMSELKILVKKAFDRGFIDGHVLGFDHFEKISDAASTIPVNHGFRTIATPHYLAIR